MENCIVMVIIVEEDCLSSYYRDYHEINEHIYQFLDCDCCAI